MLIAFHKPFNVLPQFTTSGTKSTLADYIAVPDVYPAGRLDFDSEGLMLLTDDGGLQHRIADPAGQLTKRYFAQVEGVPSTADLARLAGGITIGEGADRYRALPAVANVIAAPPVAERVPPIRHRVAIPTAWVEIALLEGRNRQVRRMTAAIGYPTLRLIRVGIGRLDLFASGLLPGMSMQVRPADLGIASAAGQTVRQTDSKSPSEPLSTVRRRRRY